MEYIHKIRRRSLLIFEKIFQRGISWPNAFAYWIEEKIEVSASSSIHFPRNNYHFEKRLRRYCSFSWTRKNIISSEEIELSVILDALSSIVSSFLKLHVRLPLARLSCPSERWNKVEDYLSVSIHFSKSVWNNVSILNIAGFRTNYF